MDDITFPERTIFRLHAVKRMFERTILESHIKEILLDGQIIKRYQDDSPYPSYLVYGIVNQRPLHVVAAIDEEDDVTIIVTAYEPNIIEWEFGFEKRKDL